MTPELTLDRLHRFLEAPPTDAAAPARDMIAEQLTELQFLLRADQKGLDQLAELYDKACVAADNGDNMIEAMSALWNGACGWMGRYQALVDEARNKARGHFRKRVLEGMTTSMARLADLMRTMAVVWPELELETPEDITEAVWTITITPGAYLRAMANVFWSAIRHPLSETTIELKTGRVLHHT